VFARRGYVVVHAAAPRLRRDRRRDAEDPGSCANPDY
jgi:hypothetical protein